jgi:hypothetical protein
MKPFIWRASTLPPTLDYFEDQWERSQEESIGTRLVEFLRGIVPPW